MTFSKDGFLIVRNLITSEEIERLNTHLSDRVEKGIYGGGYTVTCPQAVGSPSFYGGDLMKSFQVDLLPRIEDNSKLDLYKTYSFARTYKKDDILAMHTDRPACEVSVTIDLGGDKWPIWILDRYENPVKVDLNPGDGLLYRGCELSHWRSKFKGDEHSQIFVHYVEKGGPNAWAKDDIVKDQP